MIYIYDILSKNATFLMHGNTPNKNVYIYIKVRGYECSYAPGIVLTIWYTGTCKAFTHMEHTLGYQR